MRKVRVKRSALEDEPVWFKRMGVKTKSFFQPVEVQLAYLIKRREDLKKEIESLKIQVKNPRLESRSRSAGKRQIIKDLNELREIDKMIKYLKKQVRGTSESIFR